MQVKELINEIKELKNVIIHLSINLFRERKLSEEEVLDLLADAVLKREELLKRKELEYTTDWRL